MNAAPNFRTREILTQLARHAHDFVRAVRLTPSELLQAAQYLRACGAISDDVRHEFILLSDALGITMVTETLESRSPMARWKPACPVRSIGREHLWRNGGPAARAVKMTASQRWFTVEDSGQRAVRPRRPLSPRGRCVRRQALPRRPILSGERAGRPEAPGRGQTALGTATRHHLGARTAYLGLLHDIEREVGSRPEGDVHPSKTQRSALWPYWTHASWNAS